LKNSEDRLEDAVLRRLFWFEIMEDGFWMTERGSVALILGTPWNELERFMQCVKGFLERHRTMMLL
jgi:glutamate-1-semialdehyde 2,1-aminomutase